MPKIFISYRREDSRHVTGRVYDRLVGAFGPDNVFKDVDSLPLGIDFRKALTAQVAQCDVLLAVIGDAWLRADGTGATRRIDDEADFVRIEIEAALKRDIPVIPLLVGDAPVPKERQLPASLAPLAYRNGAALREDPHFNDDIDRLIRALRQVNSLGQMPPVGPGDSSIVPGSPFAPRREPAIVESEIVAAEPVFTGSPFAGNYAEPAPSGEYPALETGGSAALWWGLARWVCVALVLGLVGALGLGGPDQHFSWTFACLATIVPPALAFAAFPDVYRGLWIWSRGGTAASYRKHCRTTEGRLVFWGVYAMVIILMVLLGLAVAEPLGLFGSEW